VATKSKKKPVKKAKAVKKDKAVVKAKLKTKTAKAKAVAAKPVAAGKASSGRSRAAQPAKSIGALRMTPLEDRVIVRVDAADEKTAGGIFIPNSATERPNRGEVIAAGPGRRNKKGQLRPLDVNVGDSVLFPQYCGTKIAVDDQEFLILREDEVLGIVVT